MQASRTTSRTLGVPSGSVLTHAYTGIPGSQAPGAQPFQLAVAAAAMVELDFHAHCSTRGVLGLLGGIWDGADQILR